MVSISDEDDKEVLNISQTAFFNKCKDTHHMTSIRDFLYKIFPDVAKLKPYYTFCNMLYGTDNSELQHKQIHFLERHDKRFIYTEDKKPFGISYYMAGKNTM